MSGALELRGAAASRGGSPVWSGLDLDVAEGEFVAVLGPNGAGKSTLLDVILGLLPLSVGQVTLFTLVRSPNPRTATQCLAPGARRPTACA